MGLGTPFRLQCAALLLRSRRLPAAPLRTVCLPPDTVCLPQGSCVCCGCHLSHALVCGTCVCVWCVCVAQQRCRIVTPAAMRVCDATRRFRMSLAWIPVWQRPQPFILCSVGGGGANTASMPDAAASARQPVLDRRVWRRHPVHLVHPSRLRQQSIRLVSPPELACNNATMRVYLGTQAQMASYDKGCGKQQTLQNTCIAQLKSYE